MTFVILNSLRGFFFLFEASFLWKAQPALNSRTQAICTVHPARNNVSWPLEPDGVVDRRKEIKEENVAFRFLRPVGSYLYLYPLQLTGTLLEESFL